MFEIRAQVSINQSIEEVFAFIADNENDPKWCVPVVETRRIAGSEPGLGARYRFLSRSGLMEFGGEVDVTGFDPPHRIDWRGESRLATFVGDYTLDGGPVSTTLTESARVEMKGIMALFGGILRPQFQRSYEQQLRNLRELLESKSG